MLNIQIYNMQCGYTLEWLDFLITDLFNLAKTKQEPDEIAPEQIRFILSKIEEEKIWHLSFVNNQVFRLLEEEKIEILINQYYATLVFLRHQAWQNKSIILHRHLLFKEVQIVLDQSIEELTTFLENRFPEYLDPRQRASGTHLQGLKKDLKSFLGTAWPALKIKVNEKPLTDIVLDTLQSLLVNIKHEIPISLRDVSYYKALVQELKEFSGQGIITCQAAGLNEILISLNFTPFIL